MSNSKRTVKPKPTRRRAGVVINLQEHEGRTNVDLLQANLKKHFRKVKVTLNGSDVRRIETVSLQILLGFCISRGDAGRETGWSVMSEELQETVKQHGLTSFLVGDITAIEPR